ncbi:MAG: hypothetical protein DRJ29_02275 [Bacteroidetes bacterium]|nr:MAG: hypothetical protein DRJ29_02275 [Bacteroidota bacterium]
MAKRKVKILRIGGWIIIGIISLILLTSLIFYIRRDYVVERAMVFLNEQQPGEVQMGKMYLIPFMNFPDLTLHLQEVQFYEKELSAEMSTLEPILSLNEISVTLDLLELIRGGIMVSEARLKDGFVHMEIYPDSVSNLERALGIRFGTPSQKDTSLNSSLAIDLDKMELVNVRVRMDNRVNNEYVDVEVNQLESSFSYLSGQIQSSLEVDIYINTVNYQTINAQVDKNIKLKGSAILDPDAHMLKLEPSSLSVSGLAFETWGSIDLRSTPRLDLAFVATNEGLELLNFLFLGVLDLDEIEQIGGGSIHLNGTVQGNMSGGELPVIRMNGYAEDLGFRIKTVDRDVSGISFRLFATNGRKNDLSEGLVEVQAFSAHFPEGNINANVIAGNILSPELNIEVDCAINLEGLEEMFKKDFLSNLSGSVDIQGQLSGNVNRESGSFLNDEGSLTAILDDVSFVLNHDSVNKDSIQYISGELVLHDTILETELLALEVNGNRFDLGFSIENLLLYLLDYNRDLSAGISISSKRFDPATLLQDTSISKMIGGDIEDFYLRAAATIRKTDLDNFLDNDTISELEISIDSFGIGLPLLADISNVSAAFTFSRDSITLHHLDASIGESSFEFSGNITNYDAFSQTDSGDVVALYFNLSSELLRAEDLFTINNEFLLPQDYSTEYLKDFRIAGSLEAPVAGLVYDSVSPDFLIDIEDLGWSFRYYPSKFKDFLIRIERKGDLLVIENFQGSIGENNMALSASIENFTDSLVENMYGSFELYSDLLDINELLNYQQPDDGNEGVDSDSTEVREPPKINEMDFPNIDFTVNIGELHYGKHTIYGMNGKLRTSKEKVLYLDRFVISPEGRGTLELNGQLNVANPRQYVLSADMNLKGIDIGDLNLELESEDSIYLLKDNFRGIVDARGLAEIFITPELKVDMPSSVAQFNVVVSDGALINFTPLKAAGKFLDSKDLNNVRFDILRNRFTLMDSRIFIPRMNVESTVGQMLIVGDQGLDGSYLYLVRVPPKLAREAARSAMSEGAKDDGEDQVSQMKRGNFLGITLWSNGTESDVKLGDRRKKFQK